MSMAPYTITIAQADSDDLHERLARVRWTNSLTLFDNSSANFGREMRSTLGPARERNTQQMRATANKSGKRQE